MNPQCGLDVSVDAWHPADMSSPTDGQSSSLPVIRTDDHGSRPATANPSDHRPKPKRVGFTASSADDSPNPEVLLQPRAALYAGLPSCPTSGATTPSGYLSPTPTSGARPPAPEELVNAVHKAFGQPLPQKPKPAIRKTPSLRLNPFASAKDDDSDGEDTPARRSRNEARDRANKLAKSVGSASAPSSRRNSLDGSTAIPRAETIQLNDVGRRHAHLDDVASGDDDDALPQKPPPPKEGTLEEAKKLVRSHTRKGKADRVGLSAPAADLVSRPTTPIMERNMDDYVPQPDTYRGGIFGALLSLYNAQGGMQPFGHQRTGSGSGTTTPAFSVTPSITPQHSPPTSGASTPLGGQSRRNNWYRHGHGNGQSQTSLAHLVGSSAMLASPGVQGDYGEEVTEKLKRAPRPGMGKRSRSGGALTTAMQRISKPRLEDEIRITVHISEVMSRQRYLLKLCRALMQYGAPTHRLEECMKMSARVLEIESQFLYIPGCMIISFDDSSTHTTEVKLVRAAQGVDLGKLRDTHACYKDVVHDRIGVEEATMRLEEIQKRPVKFKPWYLIGVYGLASACVGPFAFEARLIDLPVAFFLGCLVGYLQLIAAPQSNLFNNVFEISAAVLTSFFARAFGSINGGSLFCFSALAQSSIALILPGYIVLCASSELQSKHLVAGSVRMVYAIIYSLFLGFGMTIGIVLWGLFDENATSATTCQNQMATPWTFFFVPAFTLCLCVINQAKWKQMPVMIVISFLGYIVNKYSSERFAGNTQISSTLGALAIGAMANLYSRLGTKADNFFLDFYENHVRPRYRRIRRRIRGKTDELHAAYKKTEEAVPASSSASAIYTPRTRKVGYGVAAAAMLPAIFVQVPSGLAASGSLVSGITSADQIIHNATSAAAAAATDASSTLNSAAFTVGYSVVQVAIGITVGLFLSALVIYPFGKKRSGLFSF